MDLTDTVNTWILVLLLLVQMGLPVLGILCDSPVELEQLVIFFELMLF